MATTKTDARRRKRALAIAALASLASVAVSSPAPAGSSHPQPARVAGAKRATSSDPCVPREDTLGDCLSAADVPIYLAGSSDFDSLSETYNVRLPYTPAVVVVPETVAHVEDAVSCAAQFSVPVQAKSGGHSYASYSTGGQDGSMMIVLENFQDVDLDPSTGVVEVGGGLRLGNLALRIHGDGNARALSHGTCPGVGVGGHFTHGGFGFSSRAWGLAMDAVVGLDVVLANGTSAHCSSSENSQLFWGMRGAAESFGVATRFYMQTREAPPAVVNFGIGLPGASDPGAAASYFAHLQNFTRDAPAVDRNLGVQMYMDRHGMSIGGTYLGSLSEFDAEIRPPLVAGLGADADVSATENSWLDSLAALGGAGSLGTPERGYDQHDNFYAKSLTIPALVPDSGLAAYFAFARGSDEGLSPPVEWFSIISLHGGRDSQIAARSGDEWGAYAHRDAVWVAQHYGYAADASAPFPPSGIAFIDELNAVLPDAMPETQFGGYINYVDPTLGRDEAHDLYYGDDLTERLRAYKAVIDPDNVFANPQTFEP
ncbi:carbohydrate-binding module family 18 [Zalerion maritima]|uniref:Carbohydrate-binding module family 18 n=1 Tax=Zalerion maritima TaxID=339359 RepID=A0AAD5WTU8_9PEZI|nr:carbohydrate-binding module family 18 [Zalerion maritima]